VGLRQVQSDIICVFLVASCHFENYLVEMMTQPDLSQSRMLVDSKQKHSNQMRKTRGFTLVEILIVLALIGIVAGLAMQNLGGIFGGGKEKAAQTWVNATGPAYINSYLALVGNYPTTLNDLLSPPSGVTPFVNKASDLNDPWGKPYQYTLQANNFELWTTSPEGKRLSNKDPSN
jgi:general secretion pathway protein G